MTGTQVDSALAVVPEPGTGLSERDQEALHRLAHRLKGGCLSLCAQPLAEAAGAVEALAGAGAAVDELTAAVDGLRALLSATAAFAQALLRESDADTGLPEGK